MLSKDSRVCMVNMSSAPQQHHEVDDPRTQSKSEKLKAIEDYNRYMQSLLPEEQKQNFKKLGEKFFQSFDVYKGGMYENTNDDKSIHLEEALAYIVESLKSGLHPKYLSEDEVHLVRAGFGDKWYEHWGYSEDDLK